MIRKLQPADRAVFCEMVQAFYQSDAVLHPVDPAYSQRTFDEICAGSPYVHGYLLEEDGAAAGYAQLSLTWSNEVGGTVVWLEELYIRPAFRGQGLGARFLTWLEAAYPDAARFRLEVTAENERAAKLYRSRGFQTLPYVQMVLDKNV